MAIKFGAPSMAALAGTVGDIRQQYSKAAQEENDRKLWGFIQEKAQFDRAKQQHEWAKQQAERAQAEFDRQQKERKLRDALGTDIGKSMLDYLAPGQEAPMTPRPEGFIGPPTSAPIDGAAKWTADVEPGVGARFFKQSAPAMRAIAERAAKGGPGSYDIVSPLIAAQQAQEKDTLEQFRLAKDRELQKALDLEKFERDRQTEKDRRISEGYWNKLSGDQALTRQKNLLQFEQGLGPQFKDETIQNADGTISKIRTYKDGRTEVVPIASPPSKAGPGGVGGAGQGQGFAPGTRAPNETPQPPAIPGGRSGTLQPLEGLGEAQAAGGGQKVAPAKESLTKSVARKVNVKIPKPEGTYGEFSKQEVAAQNQVKQTILTIASQADPENKVGERAKMFKKIIELQKGMIEQEAAQTGKVIDKFTLNKAATNEAWQVINNHSVVRDYPVWGKSNNMTFDAMKMAVASQIESVQNPQAREYFTGIFQETLSRIATDTKQANQSGAKGTPDEKKLLIDGLRRGLMESGVIE